MSTQPPQMLCHTLSIHMHTPAHTQTHTHKHLCPQYGAFVRGLFPRPFPRQLGQQQ